MKRWLASVGLAVGLLAMAPIAYAQDSTSSVQHVKICSLYGDGFYYIPGTDVCTNSFTGDTRQQTEGGTWRSLLPYPEGKWVTNKFLECAPLGLLRHVGTFVSTDFTLNAYGRKQTRPARLGLRPPQFISKVMMSGGFHHPLLEGGRSGTAGSTGGVGLCLRSIDPGVIEQIGETDFRNPPYGNGGLPIGCVWNSRLVGMPGAYSITATAANPQIDFTQPTADPTFVVGPYVYGAQLVVTTDVGQGGPFLLTYPDPITNEPLPLAGTLSVDVCVDGRGD